MSELADLKRQIDVLTHKVDEIHRRLDEVVGKPKPHLTRVEFAKLAGISRWTVAAKIERREIRTERGRIPRSELARYVS